MANVIYRGSMRVPPVTKNLPVKTALKPGVAVVDVNGEFVVAPADSSYFMVLNNLDFTGQTPEQAYAAGDDGAAYFVSQATTEFQLRASGAIAAGDKVAVDANGLFKKAVAGKIVVAVAESATTDGELFDARTVFPVVAA